MVAKSKKKRFVLKPKKKRFVLKSENVGPVDEGQTRKIVEETDPGFVVTAEEVRRLQVRINEALKWIAPRLQTAEGQWNDLDGLREAVTELQKKLHPGN